MRLKATIAYNGTHFFGWQIQRPCRTWKGTTDEGGYLRTVQGEVTKAVRAVVGHPTNVTGASRTDTGVHARAQVAHFDTTSEHIPLEGMRRAINAKLPDDVVITSLEPVREDFDSIFHAVNKRYQYLVWTASDRNPFYQTTAFHRWQTLDLEGMRAAAEILTGTHDFTSFTKPGHGRAHAVRTVSEFSMSHRGHLLVFGVQGSGFLWNQIRIMVGTVVEVGIGRFRPEDVGRMLAAKDRTVAGSTAPPHGLYLQWIQHRLPETPRPPKEVVPNQSPDQDSGVFEEQSTTDERR